MALIQCPECGAEVSTMAESCPKCAYPIADCGTTQAHGGRVQTVEQTSKRYKLHFIYAGSLIIIGVIAVFLVALFSGDSSKMGFAVLSVAIGFVWYAITRFNAWWHHG